MKREVRKQGGAKIIEIIFSSFCNLIHYQFFAPLCLITFSFVGLLFSSTERGKYIDSESKVRLA